MRSQPLRLRLTLHDPMGCSPSGSSVHGIFPAKILEWAAISFSRGSSGPRIELAFPASSALANGFFIICTSNDRFFYRTTWEAQEVDDVNMSLQLLLLTLFSWVR